MLHFYGNVMSLVIENHRVKNVILNNKFVRGNLIGGKANPKILLIFKASKGCFFFQGFRFKNLENVFQNSFQIYLH